MVGRGLLFAVCRVSSRLNENKENRGVKQKKKKEQKEPTSLSPLRVFRVISMEKKWG